MEYKAVIFDMFETLITEWGHEKYTKSRMCADLGVAPELFNPYWEEKEQDRYIGKINFADSVLYACEKCGKEMNAETLALICDKREKTKSACFEYVDPDVYELLRELKAKDLKLALRKLIHYGCFNRLLPTLNPVLAEMLVRHPGNELFGSAMLECLEYFTCEKILSPEEKKPYTSKSAEEKIELLKKVLS